MKLSALRKEFDKFKDTLADNIQTVFGSIPEGPNASTSFLRQSKVVLDDKSKAK